MSTVDHFDLAGVERELTIIGATIRAVLRDLEDPKLGNPKYGMDRRRLTDRLDAHREYASDLLQRKIELLLAQQPISAPAPDEMAFLDENIRLRADNARLRDMLAGRVRDGEWMVEISHGGETVEKTAYGKARISAESAASMPDDIFWTAIDHEVERIIRSIDKLEGREWRPSRRLVPDSSSLMHDDIVKLLLALGLGDHARPISPHEVMVREVIPAVEALVKIVDGFDALKAFRS